MFDDYCSQHQCFALNLAQGNNTSGIKSPEICTAKFNCFAIL